MLLNSDRLIYGNKIRMIERTMQAEGFSRDLDMSDSMDRKFAEGLFGGAELNLFPCMLEGISESAVCNGVNEPDKAGGEEEDPWTNALYLKDLHKKDANFNFEVELNLKDFAKYATVHMDLFSYIGEEVTEIIKEGEPAAAHDGALFVSNGISIEENLYNDKNVGLLYTACWSDYSGNIKASSKVALFKDLTVYKNVFNKINIEAPVLTGKHTYPYVRIQCKGSEISGIDYYVVQSASDANFYIPCKGYALFDDPMAQLGSVEASSEYMLIKRNGGGVAIYDDAKAGKSFSKCFSKYTDQSGKKGIKWDFEKIKWVPFDIFRSYSDYVDFKMVVRYKLYGEQDVHTLVIQSNADTQYGFDEAKVTPICFYWDCLSADTYITMSDGKAKLIGEVKAGDKLMGEIGIHTVASTVTSQYNFEMYKITTANNSIILSAAHPVVSVRGAVLAKDLTEGDILKNIQGRYENIITIDILRPQTVTVYNLELEGNPDFFYANNLLAGSINMDISKIVREQFILQNPLEAKWEKDITSARKYFKVMDMADGVAAFVSVPPAIKSINCEINGAKIKYHVQWDKSGKYNIVLFQDDTEKKRTDNVQGTYGYVEFDSGVNQDYKIAVEPSDNPGVFSDYIPVFSSEPIIDFALTAEDEDNLDMKYKVTTNLVKSINVTLQNDSRSVFFKKDIVPFDNHIDLKEWGIYKDKEFEVKLIASFVHSNVKVYMNTAASCKISMSAPIIKGIEMLEADTSNIKFKVTMDSDTFYSGAKMLVMLNAGNSLLWTSSDVAAPADLTVPVTALTYGGDDYYITVRYQKDNVISRPGIPHRIFFGIPELKNMDYTSIKDLRFDFCGDFPHPHNYNIMKGSAGTLKQPERINGIEKVSYEYTDGSTVKFAYVSGKTTGIYSKEISVSKPAYYILNTNSGGGLCFSHSSALKNTSDISVPIDTSIYKSKDEIGNDSFKLKGSESEKVNLWINKNCWTLTDANTRTKLKADYADFLRLMETAQVIPASVRKIRRLVGIYLPQTFDEYAYYNYYFDNNCIELFPGLVLRAEQSTYQYIGDIDGSKYLNGYAGTLAREYTVIERGDTLSLNSFIPKLSGGMFIENLSQPTAESKLMAFGGSGLSDFMGKNMETPYRAILYPEAFTSAEKQGNAEVCYNVAAISAETRGKLLGGIEQFTKMGYTSPDCPVGYLRGRANIIPCAVITVCKKQRTVPVFTTLRDIINELGLDISSLWLKRDGKPVYCFEGQNLLYDLPLYTGDEIGAGENG